MPLISFENWVFLILVGPGSAKQVCRIHRMLILLIRRLYLGLEITNRKEFIAFSTFRLFNRINTSQALQSYEFYSNKNTYLTGGWKWNHKVNEVNLAKRLLVVKRRRVRWFEFRLEKKREIRITKWCYFKEERTSSSPASITLLF